jgi:hypothetical protein
MMKIDPELLGGMYELPELRASCLQSEAFCDKYMELFSWAIGPLCVSRYDPRAHLQDGMADFVCSPLTAYKDDAAEHHPSDDLELIKLCKLFLDRKDDRVKWLAFRPTYGCVILGFATPEQPPGIVNIEILGLDGAVFALHGNFNDEKPKYDHFLKPSGKYVALPVGRIDESQLDDLKDEFEAFLRKIAAESSGGGGRGKPKREKHPYTPDFLHAVMKQALDVVVKHLDVSELPVPFIETKGGFPDYERGSRGGLPPNTSFPLVCAVLQLVLTQKRALYQKIMIYIDLR